MALVATPISFAWFFACLAAHLSNDFCTISMATVSQLIKAGRSWQKENATAEEHRAVGAGVCRVYWILAACLIVCVIVLTLCVNPDPVSDPSALLHSER